MENYRNLYDELKDWDKVEFIKKIEFDEGDKKWQFLDSVIKDENDYDLARIEALKIIEIYEIPKLDKDVLATTLESVILNTNDDDVKDYAVDSTPNFIEYDNIFQLVKKILLDENSDIDLRYSSLAAIEKIKDIKMKNEILTKLLDDKDMHKTAKRMLSEG